MSAIEIKNLTKNYGKACALSNISLTIEENRIYGLLGRNGAGKTTLLNLITNRIFPTEGMVSVDGESVLENDRALGKIHFMGESGLYPPTLKVIEMFKWTKAFFPDFDMDYAISLSEKFGLDTKKKIKSLSTGYGSIAKLITTLSSNAPIQIYDEPILGLDANHRTLFYRLLLESYIKTPKTIIISTHIIEEISDLLERVVIIRDKGVLVDDSVENLLKNAYSVSGPKSAVDTFISGKNCIGTENLSGFCRAAIMGSLDEAEKERAKQLGLETGGIELQNLFVFLTDGEVRK
jgi:ABC-type multidrug transport system, ATPase component